MKMKMDFVSSVKLNGKTRKKKINYILGKVKDGSILIVDGVMKPEEEIKRLERIRHEQYNEIKHLHEVLLDAHALMGIHDTQGAWMVLD